MIGADIVNKLKKDLSKYTSDFNDSLTINSLTALNGTITANIPSHNFTNGAYIRITGAKQSINIISITRNGLIATVKTAKDHKLIDPKYFTKEDLRKQYTKITIENVEPVEYNGDWQVLTVQDAFTFTFSISTNPSTPANSYGNILINDFESFNGYKQINVIDSDNFSYTTSDVNLSGNAGGTIQLFYSSRIDNAVSFDRAIEHYKGSNKGTRLYIVIDDDETYREGTTSTDITALSGTNESPRIDLQQNLSLYVFIEAQQNTLAGSISDTARSYRKPFLKCLANFCFQSFLSEMNYQPLQYLGSSGAGYDTTYYIHEFNFSCKGYISMKDMADFDIGTPLQEVQLTQDKNINLNVKYR